MPVSFPRITFGLALTATLGLAVAGTARTPAAKAAVTNGPVAQYLAFANAVNLRPGDVPGFTAKAPEAKHRHSTHKAPENQAQYQRCVGTGNETKPLLQTSSDEFTSGKGLRTDSASSHVQIMPTSATVVQELSRVERTFQNPTARSCLTRLYQKVFGTKGKTIHTSGASVRIQIGDIQLVPVSLGSLIEGTEGGFGLDFSMTVTYTVSARGRHVKVPVPFSLEALVFGVGRAEVTFSSVSISEKFPRELEGRLLSLMVSRALTASHADSDILE